MSKRQKSSHIAASAEVLVMLLPETDAEDDDPVIDLTTTTAAAEGTAAMEGPGAPVPPRMAEMSAARVVRKRPPPTAAIVDLTADTPPRPHVDRSTGITSPNSIDNRPSEHSFDLHQHSGRRRQRQRPRTPGNEHVVTLLSSPETARDPVLTEPIRQQSAVVVEENKSSTPPVVSDTTSVPAGVDCGICMERMVFGANNSVGEDPAGNSAPKLASTHCGHVFCESCLREWVRLKHSCPTCRKRVTMKQVHRLYLPIG